MGEFADKFKKWVSRYGVEFIPDPPPAPPIRESDRQPVGSTPVHQLPTTLAEIPDADADYSTASIWAQIFCGNGKVRSQRVPTAAELQRKNLGAANAAFNQKWGQYLQLDARVGKSDAVRKPQGPSAREVAVQQMREAHQRLKDQGIDLA